MKEHLKSKHNINVHFSDKSLGYIVAYRYICKSDKEVLHSENHPDLRDIGSPRTKACMKANKAKNSATQKSGELKCLLSSKGTEVSLAKVKTKRPRFTTVAEYILYNRIRSYTSLQATVLIHRQEGEKDLFSFLARNTSKSVQDLIERVWSMHGAAEKENSEIISRTEKLVSTGNQECIAVCNGKWLQAACQVLSWNSINKFVFAAAVRELLEKDRKKRLSIFLVGPSNCGKSFLLEPLKQIFNCFTNPAQGKYAWTGLVEAEVAYINNFCWPKELIVWQELLNLLEVLLPANLVTPKMFLQLIYTFLVSIPFQFLPLQYAPQNMLGLMV